MTVQYLPPLPTALPPALPPVPHPAAPPVPPGAREAVRRRRVGVSLRAFVGAALLVGIVVRFGAAPFVHGLLSLDLPTLAAGLVLVAVATTAAAWRWRLIAARFGVGLRWSTAVGMYYRSQFVNSVLPGGVVGDVQRAIDHGRSAERRAAAARAVALERLVGQAVQLAIAVAVLAVSGAGFEGALLPVVGVGVALATAAVGGAALASRRLRSVLRHESRELRAGLGSLSVGVQAVVASIVVYACHVGMFAIAAAAVGAQVPPARMLTLATVVLLAASLPLNLGGWGPREGVAGWAFAMAGFGASAGISAATLYGVLGFVCIAAGALITQLVSLARTRRERS